MKRAVIMADGKLVTAEDLDLEARERGGASGQPQVGARARRPAGDPPGAGADREQHLERRQAARDQPADALRPDEAIRSSAVSAARRLDRPAAARRRLLERGRQRPRKPIAAGCRRWRTGQPRTARIEFLNAIKADPDNKALRLAQARTYLLLGDGAAAEAELKRANALGVAESETAHLMAHALLLQGQAERAVAEARKAGPAHAAYADRMLGRALAALGRDGGGRGGLRPGAGGGSRRRRAVGRHRPLPPRHRRDRRARSPPPTAPSRSAPRNVEALSPARRADPQPIWPRRRHALVRPGARDRPRQRRRR